MDIEKHLVFDKENAPELWDYLQENNIPFKDTNGLLTMDIRESSPHWDSIRQRITDRRVICLSETFFTKKELSSAPWLCVRSKWLCGYPQPEGAFRYEAITYNNQHHCKECGIGLKQAAPFRIKKAPKWGNRHFMMLNWIADELFVDETVKSIFQENHVTGISFSEVMNTKGTEIFPGSYQLMIEQSTAPGFIEGLGDLHATYICPQCGSKKHHPNGIGMHAFQKDALNGMPDICKSSEFFGWGHAASQLIFIRQNVYRLIIENHLERGLVFAPIQLNTGDS